MIEYIADGKGNAEDRHHIRHVFFQGRSFRIEIIVLYNVLTLPVF